MKKIFTLFFVVTCALSVNAQRSSNGSTPVNHSYLSTNQNARAFTDTLLPQGFGDASLSCTLSLYNSTGGGYVGGNNGYGDLQKAQMFDPMHYWVGAISGNVKVTEVLVWFGAKKQGGNSNLHITIRGGDEFAGPGSVLGNSSNITMTDVDTGLNIILTSFPFASPVSVPDKFFACVVLPTGADTVGIVSTTSPCSGAFGYTWDLFANGTTWKAIGDAQNWGLDVDFTIFAVVDHDAAIGILNTPEINLNPVYPNPAFDEVNLNYALRTSSNVTISVVDVTGKIIKTLDLGKNNSGIYNTPLNISDLANGVYTVTVNTNTTQAVTKLVVAK